jgi:hypothetical protein
MRFTVLITGLILLGLSQAKAMDLYAGPQFGVTSYSLSTGEKDRESQYSYGADVMAFKGPWGLGTHFSYLSYPQDGNTVVNVQESDFMATLEGKYRVLLSPAFNPYVTLGAGPLYKTINTSVMGASEKNTDFYLVQDIGLGVMGEIVKDFGYNLSLKYYQYSNVSGFNYALSLGYYSLNLL